MFILWVESNMTAPSIYLHLGCPGIVISFPQDGESQRIAFVDFHSVDQADLFMKIFGKFLATM